MLEGEPTIKEMTESATNFMIRSVRAFPHQVSILALGPLTNIALAAKLDGDFPLLTKELVVMGGSFDPRPVATEFANEYAHNPRLEFNFRWDPEAARIVLHAPWSKIVQVPVDPTTKTQFTLAHLKEIATGKTPLTQYIEKYAEVGYPMWDELAVGVWLNPALVTKSAEARVDVDTSFTAGYGNTLSWAINAGPGLGERPVSIVYDIDAAKFEALFVELMKKPTPKAPSS